MSEKRYETWSEFQGAVILRLGFELPPWMGQLLRESLYITGIHDPYSQADVTLAIKKLDLFRHVAEHIVMGK